LAQAAANTEKYTVNIALSGWSGVGTTSLTLVLALLLKRRYLYIGKVFRYLDSKLRTSDKALTLEFEQFIQPQVGRMLDNYIDYKLLNSDNLIVESDLSTFRIGKHPKVYSVFIKATEAVRERRTRKEGRKKLEAPLSERDAAIREEYKKLWEIDIFDEELIYKKYNLIIDNSKLSVEQELRAILERLQEHPKFKSDYKWPQIEKNVPKVLNWYEKQGKAKIEKELTKRKLIIDVTEILTETVKLFPEDIQSFPPAVQKLFLGQD
jgi:cytidylate kinase